MSVQVRPPVLIFAYVAQSVEHFHGKEGVTGSNPVVGLCKEVNFFEIEGAGYMRVNVELECTECKRRNYSTNKNKKNTTERIELNKYCKFDRKHTKHKEVKK